MIAAEFPVIISRMLACHSENISLNPCFTPSRLDMKKNMLSPTVSISRILSFDNRGILEYHDFVFLDIFVPLWC